MAGVFFVPALKEGDTRATLEADEAKHAAAVRRMRVGEEITITNGHGLLATCEVTLVETRPPRVEASVRQVDKVAKPGPIRLAAAMPKGDRQRVLLEMATQVGASEFTPLLCERSVSKESANSQERWQRYCVEAMKQSRRAWLPRVNPASGLKELIDSLPGETVLVCASTEGIHARALGEIKPDRAIVIVVGPEGGFTGDELETIRKKGALEINLGDGVLRTETAAVVITSLLRLLPG